MCERETVTEREGLCRAREVIVGAQCDGATLKHYVGDEVKQDRLTRKVDPGRIDSGTLAQPVAPSRTAV